MNFQFKLPSLLAAVVFAGFAIGASAQEADLAVTKTGPSVAPAGSNVSYDITVTNVGPDDAVSVTLSDPVPPGMSFVSANQNTGPTFTCNSAVDCTIATLPAGATATFTFVFHMDEGDSFQNFATISSQTFDPNDENNTGSTYTTTPPPPTGDLSLSKSAPSGVAPDTDVTFTITLTNAGPDAAENVTLTDNLPAPLTFVSFIQTSGPVMSCGTSTCTLAAFPAGATATFELTGHVPSGTPAGTEITNVATVASDNDPGAENNVAVATVVVSVADVQIVKSGPATAVAGTDISYDLTVQNAGPDAATGVTLADNLPPGATFVSLSGGSGSCSLPPLGQGGLLTCTWPTLSVGQTSTATLTVHLASNMTSLSNTATVSSGSADSNANNNSSTVSTVITQSADVSVTKSGPATVTAGSNVSWTLTVANAGPSDAASVVLSDTLPAGTTFVSLNQTTGPAFNCTSGATITCTAATLTAGATATFTVVATVSPSATLPVSNTATIASQTSDPDPSDNSSTVISTIVSSADLTIQKSGPVALTPPQNVTWTVTVTNAGPSDAANVVVTDALPANTTFVSWTQTTGPLFACTGTTTVTCTIAVFPAGSTATFDFVATVGIGATGPLSNTATVSSSTSDPNGLNNTATSTLVVGVAPADVGITKTAGSVDVNTAVVTYTIVVTNQGPGPADGVVVTDPLPAGTELAGTPTTTQGTCTGNPLVTCTVGTLAPNASATITIPVRVRRSGDIVNTATVTSTTPDPNPANGSASATVAAQQSVPIPTLSPWALAFLALALGAVLVLRSR